MLMSHNKEYSLLEHVHNQRVMTCDKIDKCACVDNQRLMKAVGRFPIPVSAGCMSVGSGRSGGFLMIRQSVNDADCVCQVVSRSGYAEAVGGAFFCRGGSHPRRAVAITYPSQKGGHIFSVCQTIGKSLIHSESTHYTDVKLSYDVLSWWCCADNCADNCADKSIHK
jgi:hypothetical protein